MKKLLLLSPCVMKSKEYVTDLEMFWGGAEGSKGGPLADSGVGCVRNYITDLICMRLSLFQKLEGGDYKWTIGAVQEC